MGMVQSGGAAANGTPVPPRRLPIEHVDGSQMDDLP